MKRKILAVGFVFLVLGSVAIMAYWESLLAGFLRSTLASRYHLQLDSEGLSMGVRAGRVSFDQPRLLDTAYQSLGVLADASRLVIGMNIRQAVKGKVQVQSVNATQVQMHLQHLPNGRLQLADVIDRFVPKPKIIAAAASVASSTGAKPAAASARVENASPPAGEARPEVRRPETKVPVFELADSRFHYQDPSKTYYRIDTKRVKVDPQADDITVEGAQAYYQEQTDRPIMSLERLKILNLMLPDHEKLQISISGLVAETRRLENDRFDVTNSFTAWREVIEQIIHTISPPRPGRKISPKELETLNLSNISVLMLPEAGDANSPGAVQVVAELIQIQGNNDLVLTNVHVTEAGQEALQLKQLRFTGLRQGLAQLETVQMQGVNLNVLGNADRVLNVNRAIDQIQSLIRSLFPPKEQKAESAQTSLAPFGALRTVDLQDIRLHSGKSEEQSALTLDRLQYDQSRNLAMLTGFSLTGTQESSPSLQVDSLLAKTLPKLSFTSFPSVQVDGMRVRTHIHREQDTLAGLIGEWQTLPKRILNETGTDTLPEKNKKSTTPFEIQELQVQHARADIRDVTSGKEVMHRFNPINVVWKNVVFGAIPPVMGDITFSAHAIAPSTGEIHMQGRASPDWREVNVDLNTRIRTVDLHAYEAYFGKNQSILVEKGGVLVQGINRIVNNRVDAVFDITLFNPTFQVREGSLPDQIESHTLLTALNGLRDGEGNIVLQANQIRGNIKDTQFSFGTGFLDILGRNIYNRLFSIPGIAKDIAGTGAGMVGDLLKGLFGGESPKK